MKTILNQEIALANKELETLIGKQSDLEKNRVDKPTFADIYEELDYLEKNRYFSEKDSYKDQILDLKRYLSNPEPKTQKDIFLHLEKDGQKLNAELLKGRYGYYFRYNGENISITKKNIKIGFSFIETEVVYSKYRFMSDIVIHEINSRSISKKPMGVGYNLVSLDDLVSRDNKELEFNKKIYDLVAYNLSSDSYNAIKKIASIIDCKIISDEGDFIEVSFNNESEYLFNDLENVAIMFCY